MTEWVIPRRLTSGVPVSPDLSPAEAATVARFDAAPDAEESLRERVTRAVLPWAPTPWPNTDARRRYALEMADAAIAVIRGDDA